MRLEKMNKVLAILAPEQFRNNMTEEADCTFHVHLPYPFDRLMIKITNVTRRTGDNGIIGFTMYYVTSYNSISGNAVPDYKLGYDEYIRCSEPKHGYIMGLNDEQHIDVERMVDFVKPFEFIDAIEDIDLVAYTELYKRRELGITSDSRVTIPRSQS